MNKNFLKKTAVFVIFIFGFFLLSESFPTDTANQKSDKELLQQGEELYKNGEYEKALRVFQEAEPYITDTSKRLILYFYMSLTHYALSNSNQAEKSLRNVFGLAPGYSVIDENYPRGFIKIFNKIKAEIKAKIEAEKRAKEKEKEKIIEKPKPKKPEKKKKKFPALLVVTGVAIIAAAVLLLGKKEETVSADIIRIDPNYDTNVLGIEWIDIPLGEFQMGDNFNEGEADERPVHTVYLSSYKISKYELTFDQYNAFCNDTGRSIPGDFGYGRGTRPVINVSWRDARDFCDWLSQKTGKNIYLPTEAQWEKAARGTDQRKFPWGNNSPTCNLANYVKCEGVGTMPVGSYPLGVSPYGVHDMAGNVMELCSDFYSSTYYSNSPRNNPTGPSSGADHVVRGGNWDSYPGVMRTTYRYHVPPGESGFTLGFRIAMD